MTPVSNPAPPEPGSHLLGSCRQEWLVQRIIRADDEPAVWLVHLIAAADASAGRRHLSQVLNCDEFADFCRDQGLA
jgi:hypothetical protein